MTCRARLPAPRGSAALARTAVSGIVVGLVLAGCSAAVAHPTGGSVSVARVADRPTAAAPAATPVPSPARSTSSAPLQPSASPDSPSSAPTPTAGSTSTTDPTIASDLVGPTAAPSTAGSTAVPSTGGSTSAPSTADPTGQALTSPAAAVSYAGSPDVGALFTGSTAGTHGCSASVVDSPGRDLLVTAAHCVSGTGAGLEFVPGYIDGTNPYGTWSVQAAFADPSWISDQDPTVDVVFLRVAPHLGSGGTVNIEDVVGANTLASAPADGTPVTVDGYAAGSYDRPITCTADVSETQAYPTFGCGGFVAGTSGGPWLTSGYSGGPEQLVGIIGGLNQGGCSDDISYSPPFGSDITALWLRACAGDDPDTLPVPGPDGC